MSNNSTSSTTAGTTQNQTSPTPVFQIKYFPHFIVICLLVSIILVLIYALAILLCQDMLVRRNSEAQVSAKTREKINRRRSFKEKINSVYVHWKPVDDTSVEYIS
ncbi:uncharacterized protein Hap1MRO34_020441 [Clarias gariepinus]